MFGSMVPWKERSLFPTVRFPRTMSRMEDEMEDLMARYFGNDTGWLRESPQFVPTIDLVETENQFEVTVDLPGLKPDEVDVEFSNGNLSISGKREQEKEEKGKTFHRVERRYGEFRRLLPLPTSIDKEHIEAKFEDGVLKITVPRTDDVKTKHIEVKA